MGNQVLILAWHMQIYNENQIWTTELYICPTKHTFKASLNTTTFPFCFQLHKVFRVNSSNILIDEAIESSVKRLDIRRLMSLCCSWEAQSKLWSPKSSAIDLMYLFEKSIESQLRIALAASMLDIKTCVSPSMLVLKQFPYLQKGQERNDPEKQMAKVNKLEALTKSSQHLGTKWNPRTRKAEFPVNLSYLLTGAGYFAKVKL